MNKAKKGIIAIVAMAILIFLDKWTKYLVASNLELHETIPVIEGVFQINFIKNVGMAWSMLSGKQILFIVLTPIVIFFLVKEFLCLPNEKKYTPIRVICVFLVAGAIGNLIDRIGFGEELFHGGVIDFLDFCLINFPVFNVADIYVTCSVIALLIVMLVKYKEDDFDVIVNSCIKFK